MLKELIAIFRSEAPMKPIADVFADMLGRSVELTYRAGSLFFGPKVGEVELKNTKRSDIKINKLQRKIRKRVLIHLATHEGASDLPYCMLLMSLVKDVERIGDYAKDLVALRCECDSLPTHNLVETLSGLRARVEDHLRAASDAFALSEKNTAESLLREGQKTISELDTMVDSLAASDLEPRSLTVLVLSAHYYKRICSHSLNIVSSVVQPLHRLDYYTPRRSPKTKEPATAATN